MRERTVLLVVGLAILLLCCLLALATIVLLAAIGWLEGLNPGPFGPVIEWASKQGADAPLWRPGWRAAYASVGFATSSFMRSNSARSRFSCSATAVSISALS
jgi:hypothetical protein